MSKQPIFLADGSLNPAAVQAAGLAKNPERGQNKPLYVDAGGSDTVERVARILARNDLADRDDSYFDLLAAELIIVARAGSDFEGREKV